MLKKFRIFLFVALVTFGFAAPRLASAVESLLLPRDFTDTGCPDLTGYTKIYDLEVTITSPDATPHDINHDHRTDSWLTESFAEVPKTFDLHVNSLLLPVPPARVDMTVPPRIIGAQVVDTDGTHLHPAVDSYGDDLLLTMWQSPYWRPILDYPVVNGIEYFMNPGAHQFSAYFATKNHIQHCTLSSTVIIICPLAGVCD